LPTDTSEISEEAKQSKELVKALRFPSSFVFVLQWCDTANLAVLSTVSAPALFIRVMVDTLMHPSTFRRLMLSIELLEGTHFLDARYVETVWAPERILLIQHRHNQMHSFAKHKHNHKHHALRNKGGKQRKFSSIRREQVALMHHCTMPRKGFCLEHHQKTRTAH
jgi:hypothetical protein